MSKYVVRDSEKQRFIKEPRASALPSRLGIKTLFCQIPLVGPLLF